jgi:hypothetical protein
VLQGFYLYPATPKGQKPVKGPRQFNPDAQALIAKVCLPRRAGAPPAWEALTSRTRAPASCAARGEHQGCVARTRGNGRPDGNAVPDRGCNVAPGTLLGIAAAAMLLLQLLCWLVG